MSVTVSKVYDTYMATADWGGHKHSISKDDREVPSWSEFVSLDRRADRLTAECSALGDDLKNLEGRVESFVSELSAKERKLSDKIRESTKKLLEELRAEIQDRGMLSQAYQEVTNKHLLRIEGASAKLHEYIEKVSVGFEEKIKKLYEEEQKNLADYAGLLESRIDKITKEALDVKNDLAAHVQVLIRKKEEITEALNQFAKVEKSASKFKDDFQEAINRLAPVMKDVETVEKRVDEVQTAAQKCTEFISGISSSAEDRIQNMENMCRGKIVSIDALCVEYENKYLDMAGKDRSLRESVVAFNELSSSFWMRLKWLFTGKNVKTTGDENVENKEG